MEKNNHIHSNFIIIYLGQMNANSIVGYANLLYDHLAEVSSLFTCDFS
jgi:hypothetical protein